MTTLEAIIGGATYSLSDGAPFAIIDSEDGMAPVRRITDRGPLQDGDSDLGFRLEPIVWPLALRLVANNIATHYDVRDTALRIFRPSRTAIQIRWTLDNGAVRQLDCHVSGRLAFASRERQGFNQKCVVPLRAANPLYYDPAMQAVTYGVGAGSGGFAFPLSWPASFGGSTVNQTRAIAYVGSYREFPIVIIKGPITNPVVTNLTTGDKLDFTGVTIGSGTTYTIDCRPGKKSVLDQDGANRIAGLSDDSDLATFSLEADPEAPGGINSVHVTGTSANATTEIYLQWYSRYVGI